MSSRLSHTLAILGWLPIVVWVLFYIPAVVREVLHEGAGDGLAFLITALWLLGPPALMSTVQAPHLMPQKNHPGFYRLSLLLLLGALALLVSSLFPSPLSNRDLFLPTLALLSFLLIHLIVVVLSAHDASRANA